MIIKRVLLNKKTGTKYVIIPARSDIKHDDFVEIIKVDRKEVKDGDTGITRWIIQKESKFRSI